MFWRDAIVVSYPRSGLHWLHWTLWLVWRQLDPEAPATPTRAIKGTHNGQGLTKTRRQARFSHRGYRRAQSTKKILRGRRVVWLARDPRDIVASNYRTIGTGSFAAWIRDPVYGIEAICDWMEWWSSIGRRRARLGWDLFAYERRLADPEGELRRLLAFLGTEASDEVVYRAVENSTVEKMRAHELRAGGMFGDPSPRRSKFVESGGAGKWDSWPAEDQAYAEKVLSDNNRPDHFVFSEIRNAHMALFI